MAPSHRIGIFLHQSRNLGRIFLYTHGVADKSPIWASLKNIKNGLALKKTAVIEEAAATKCRKVPNYRALQTQKCHKWIKNPEFQTHPNT